MILYNVTVKIDTDIHQEWLHWMKTVHIPDVMATGFFREHKILKLLEPGDDEDGVTYALQYFCNNIEALRRYWNEYAPGLQAEHSERYQGKFVAFRTVMEVI